MARKQATSAGLSASCLLITATLLSATTAQSPSLLAQKAKAILDANCSACHGETKMGGLDLRQRSTALEGGARGPALVPGNPEASLLYKAVLQTGEVKMPMGRPKLSAEDLATLREWIKQGAPWEASASQSVASTWWSFKKPVRPAVPAVKN